jgi:hypothetical protein
MKLSIDVVNDAHRKQGASRLILGHEDMLILLPARGSITVSCMAGCLHLTQTGDPRDHLLLPGDSHTCFRRGKVVVTAPRSPAAAVIATTGPLTGKQGMRWDSLARPAA